MRKKGIELTLNTIIIAALALIVLVVLMIAFTGGFGEAFTKLRSLMKGGFAKADCMPINSADDKDNDGYSDSRSFDFECKGTSKECKCDTAITEATKNIAKECSECK